MTSRSTQPKRIVVRASGVSHDIVVAAENPLGVVLGAIGVHLGAADRLLGPEGKAVDPATLAVELSEGGVYSVARAYPEHAEAKRGSKGSLRSERAGAPWGLTLFGVVTVAGAMTSDAEWLRWTAVGVLGALGFILALAWSLRVQSTTMIASILVPLGFAAAAAGLAASEVLPGVPTFAGAAGAFAAAALASVIGVASGSMRARAGAWSVAIVLLGVGGLALLSQPLGWSLTQLSMVVSAVAVPTIRALPTLTLSVDDGYHVDYGLFMVLRWTVRGRMPEYRSSIDSAQAHAMVDAAGARMDTALPLLSLLAVPGIPALFSALDSNSLLERIAGAAALIFCTVGLLLVSRRTTRVHLRRAPRLAVTAGLVFSALILPSVFQATPIQYVFACILLFAGLVAAAVVIPLAGGSRSLSWSRSGDIVESIAVALVVPAALLAAGTIDTLRGVLVA